MFDYYIERTLKKSFINETKVLCEVFVNDEWQQFDGHGTDIESSLDWYSKNYESFASGSLPLRYNGVVAKKDSSPNSIFYKRKR